MREGGEGSGESLSSSVGSVAVGSGFREMEFQFAFKGLVSTVPTKALNPNPQDSMNNNSTALLSHSSHYSSSSFLFTSALAISFSFLKGGMVFKRMFKIF